jgi:prephenate dehydrogenase
MRWKKVTLVGVGLLGGSLDMAVRRQRLAGSVAGFVRRTASVGECRRFGAVDFATRNLEQAVRGADLIVLCTPIAQMRAIAKQMLPFLAPGTIVTDVGSVKGPVVRSLEPLLARTDVHFVGSHPMAGSEKTGVTAAAPDLFQNAVCVVTPTRGSNPAAVRKVVQLWKSVGARVLKLDPRTHDELVSRSSHLPHVVAANLANLVLASGNLKQQPALCANGFRDTTRIASGSPEMWRDIALANHQNLSAALGVFMAELARFRRALKKGDATVISRFFETAKQRRDRWSAGFASRSQE